MHTDTGSLEEKVLFENVEHRICNQRPLFLEFTNGHVKSISDGGKGRLEALRIFPSIQHA